MYIELATSAKPVPREALVNDLACIEAINHASMRLVVELNGLS